MLNTVVQGGGYVGALAALREISTSHAGDGANGPKIRLVFPFIWQRGQPS